MKKIFALALAALMTAGMTTVAFADKGDVNFINVDTKVYAIVDANDDNTFNSQKETVDASATGVISSLPSVAPVTIYFSVLSTVPIVPSANAAGYSPASVPFAPTWIAEKSAPSGAPVNPLTLCSCPL